LDNITHTLAGGLLGQMGLKRQSRFAMAACLLGANAPDIDVFGPLVLPVDQIMFHRGPVHSVFAVPILAAALTGLLWLVNWVWPNPKAPPFRAGPLFLVSLIAVASHPFLDWLTTYAIALLAPVSWHWYSGDAIFIVDWVYWLLMIGGIVWSARRWRRNLPHPGRPAQIAGILLAAYIGFNLAESAYAEHRASNALRQRGIEPVLVVASPPPFAFWDRAILWRSADRWGSGWYDPAKGLSLIPGSQPTNLNDPKLLQAKANIPHVRAFLVWSRMPIVVRLDGHTYLTDQRFYRPPIPGFVSRKLRFSLGKHNFMVPLD
jgi:inner membrane protein